MAIRICAFPPAESDDQVGIRGGSPHSPGDRHRDAVGCLSTASVPEWFWLVGQDLDGVVYDSGSAPITDSR
jgi:hypothetical protein